MLHPAKPFASRPSAAGSTAQAIAAKAELNNVVDRARDERFRLLKMLKEARAELNQSAAALTPSTKPTLTARGPTNEASPSTQPAPTDAAAQRLLEKLAALDAALDAKAERINRLADEREARLKQMQDALDQSLRQAEASVAAGRLLRGELQAAMRDAQGLPGRVLEQLDRVDQYVAQMTAGGCDALHEAQHEAQPPRLDKRLGDLLGRQADRRAA